MHGSYDFAVKAILRRPDGKILLIRDAGRYKREYLKGYWDIPGGRLDQGEIIDAALSREVMEEAGIDIKKLPRSRFALNQWASAPADDQREIIGAVCIVELERDSEVVISNEHDEYKWVLPKNIELSTLKPAFVPMFKELLDI